MKRRSFLGTSLAMAAPLIAQTPKRRPNILYCLADDWMHPHAGAYGESVVKTPVFDRVAKSGVLFTNAFVAAPSCSPSRAAMLTGRYHWSLEEGGNLGGTLPVKYQVYPDLLEAAGYHVGFTRKGWSPGDPKPGGRTRNPAGPTFADFDAFLSARKSKDAPFCFWFGSIDPHRPYERNSGVQSGIDAKAVRVPPYLPDTDVVRRDICDYFYEVQRFDREVGEVLAKVEALGELENTIVVITGDNGWPFPRSKANIYDSGTHAPLAISWPARIKGGRRVDDFVSLADLAPTYLTAAGLPVPAALQGRSLLALLESGKSGQVESSRDHVLTGMERHVPSRGEIKGGYPCRAIRTRDHLYIRNFHPDRWPAGDPPPADAKFDDLANSTFLGFADADAGASKAWMFEHRNEPAVKPLFDKAFGKRPARELYDLRSDPYQLTNIAEDAKSARIVRDLDAKLMKRLKETEDPRATPGGGEEFDKYIWYQGRGQQKARPRKD